MTSDGDAGPGTLRAAILEANAVCKGDEPCTITFFDHPEILPKTIFVNTPLPVITACELIIRSVRRPPDLPDFTWGINGHTLTSGDGLVFRPSCDGNRIEVDGLSVASFPGDGIVALGPAPLFYTFTRLNISGRSRGIAIEAWNSDFTITHSTVGNTGRSAITLWGARRTTIANVRIGVTEHGATLPVGASGVFVGPDGGNVTVLQSLISNARDFGLALAYGNARIAISDVFMTSNKAGDIDWGLDGPSSHPDVPATPRIFSATYDPVRNVTHIVTEPGVVVFSSTTLTLFLNAHLERFAGVAGANGIVDAPGDLRGRYVSGYRQEIGLVSEVSPAVLVR